MITTKLVQSNRGQTLRIPKALAFGEHIKEVTIARYGKGLLIRPNENIWDDFFKQPGSEDFMSENRD